MSEPAPHIALAATRLRRPALLAGSVEIVSAAVARRAFPTHLSTSLGLCVKVGGPRTEAPNWPRELTADSLPTYFAYNAVAAAPLVAPTPLLVVHGTVDDALLPAYAQAAFDAAQGTKELVWMETSNHVELYDQDPYVSEAAGHAIGWLDRHLRAAG